MTRLKGKVKAIPVISVTEGQQVLYSNSIEVLQAVISSEKHCFLKGYDPEDLVEITELKTLVVEYRKETHNPNDTYPHRTLIKQLPLKYSQWQSAIDNGEVDNDKEVEFEVVNMVLSTTCEDDYDYQIAKIIPQQKRMYSETQVKELCRQAHHIGGAYQSMKNANNTTEPYYSSTEFETWYARAIGEYLPKQN